jgi:hypothetical protein
VKIIDFGRAQKVCDAEDANSEMEWLLELLGIPVI